MKHLFLLSFLLVCTVMKAQVKLPEVFTDNMVLQQGKKITLWGEAAPGEKVSVRFQKQKLQTVADANGRWEVALNELTATTKPQKLTVKGKKNTVKLENILVGEVWLVSGQSNMEYSMNDHPHYQKPYKGDPDYLKKAFDAANSPNIRVMYIDKNLKVDSLPTKGWQTLSPEALSPVSAIGYFFAKRLTDELGVPVGIISTSWGGSNIESWSVPEGKRWKKMVKPMAGYGLRGFLWYQGCADLLEGDMENYGDMQRKLIGDWRREWKDDSLPFYYVQLAPYAYSDRKTDERGTAWDILPRFWQVQESCLDVLNTAMVTTTDLVDDIKDIHPSYKWIVAERLALCALARDYGKDVEYRGPHFKQMSLEEGKIIVEFDHVGSGLTTNDGKAPTWFWFRNERGHWKRAKQVSIVDGNKVVIEYPNYFRPASVRFAWDDRAQPNLTSKEGLPAWSFKAVEKNYKKKK